MEQRQFYMLMGKELLKQIAQLQNYRHGLQTQAALIQEE